jgi:hypothetical protein
MSRGVQPTHSSLETVLLSFPHSCFFTFVVLDLSEAK